MPQSKQEAPPKKSTFAQVKGWKDHQHYKNRRPPWIKLHRSLLDDYDFHCLPFASRALAPMLWLLASENEGVVDCSPEFLSFRLRMDKAEARDAVKPLISNGWLIPEQGDSKALATCEQGACLETEGETEKEEEKSRKPLSSSASEPDRVRQVFEHWQVVMDHPKAKLDDKRRAKIKKRLSDGYTVRDLCAAVDGCRRSPHHMGENDRGTRYDDIELICRDAPHVDKFIKLAESPNLAELGSAGRQTANAAMEWINAD